MPVADPDPTWSDWFANLFKSQPASGAPPQPAGLSINGMVPATPGVMAGPQPVISDFQPPAPPQPQQQGGYWLPAIAQGVWNTAKSGFTLPGDVATGKATMADPATQRRVGDMATLATLAAGAAPAEPGALNMGIRAYHGSPYSFDRFDISKLGEGEGSNAFGQGLYFAENEDVAKSYRQIKPAGSMYEVNINADPDQFLDWDKSFAEQSPKVQFALENLWLKKGNELGGDLPPFVRFEGRDTGQFIHNAIDAAYPRLGASGALQSEGVTGVKYLDQGSRSAGTGTQNYVTFSDKIVNIMRKYGLGALGAGAGGAMMLHRGQPPQPGA